jgi:hypothetical protein
LKQRHGGVGRTMERGWLLQTHGARETAGNRTRGAGAPGSYAVLGYRGYMFGSAVRPKMKTGTQQGNRDAMKQLSGGTGEQLESGISLKQQNGRGWPRHGVGLAMAAKNTWRRGNGRKRSQGYNGTETQSHMSR